MGRGEGGKGFRFAVFHEGDAISTSASQMSNDRAGSRYAPVFASYYRTVIPADAVACADVTLRPAFRLGRTLMYVRGAYYLHILCDTAGAARG